MGELRHRIYGSTKFLGAENHILRNILVNESRAPILGVLATILRAICVQPLSGNNLSYQLSSPAAILR